MVFPLPAEFGLSLSHTHTHMKLNPLQVSSLGLHLLLLIVLITGFYRCIYVYLWHKHCVSWPASHPNSRILSQGEGASSSLWPMDNPNGTKKKEPAMPTSKTRKPPRLRTNRLKQGTCFSQGLLFPHCALPLLWLLIIVITTVYISLSAHLNDKYLKSRANTVISKSPNAPSEDSGTFSEHMHLPLCVYSSFW
jgi:hypothetical protein